MEAEPPTSNKNARWAVAGSSREVKSDLGNCQPLPRRNSVIALSFREGDKWGGVSNQATTPFFSLTNKEFVKMVKDIVDPPVAPAKVMEENTHPIVQKIEPTIEHVKFYNAMVFKMQKLMRRYGRIRNIDIVSILGCLTGVVIGMCDPKSHPLARQIAIDNMDRSIANQLSAANQAMQPANSEQPEG